ncbi:DUF4263 domain-containing protein [Mesorhizobium sp. WSM4310]|uniref:Shedu immune nuclease family protein n=1 Tax=Mesorhizobium sp. WSM4310 TaxID=2589883 RepID=UPI00115D1C23|nr:Shedu immune nuclease family protein [Mesorhizobium sp. WSM4310]TRC89690.1 DUF4263 domain-containing protein [Mesorhizobium sp. WSM4310]
MIWFEVDEKGVTLEYVADLGNNQWVARELEQNGRVTLTKVFFFRQADLIDDKPDDGDDDDDDDDDEQKLYRFRFATTKGGYHHIPGRILGLKSDVLIVAQGVMLDRKTFAAERNIGIFRHIAKLKKDSGAIVIGGDREGNIPLEAFLELLERFPNTMELNRYAAARVEAVLGEFFEGKQSAREQYETYLNKRNASASSRVRKEELLQAELDKFVFLRDTLSAWLDQATNYSEKQWQAMVISVILLLFPKYVAVLENVRIADFYSTPGRRKNRYIDLCLVDANGNIDVIEIKKPFDDVLLSKSLYRDNYVPTKELSGTIMQAEKYLIHLSKWGVDGERELSERYGTKLPADLQIRVTNPKAMLLLGRDRRAGGAAALTESQSFDLEVIKRKYANMMDIVTYDDLLRRLDRIIASVASRMAAEE